MNDMMKNVEMNTAAQETTAVVAANSTLSTAVQQPAAPAPADTEMIVTTFTDNKEQASAAAPADEKKQEEKKKPKKHRKTNHCREDHEKKQLIVTKETTKPGTAAFNELMDKRKLYPDYTIVYRTARKSENRSITNGLTVENMRKYIEIKHPNDEARLGIFDTQKNLSELYSSPITYMRRWFRANYPQYWEDAKHDKKKAATA